MRFSSLIVALLLYSFTGCGGVRTDYSSVDLATVRGAISLDDQPLPGATVIFEAPDKTTSSAVTDESGNYRLMFNSEKAGVTPGPKVVRIRTSLPIEEDDSIEVDFDQPITKPERVPPCYNTESQLRITVEDGSQRFDFELNSDCSTTSPSN